MSSARVGSAFRFAAVFAVLSATGCNDPFLPDSERAYIQVATGGQHTCALTASGTAFCWGRGRDGELGDGRSANSFEPVRVAGDLHFTSITAGEAHTCALATDGRVYCWGWAVFAQLGNPNSAVTNRPVAVESDLQFTAVSAGTHHTCAIAQDARVFCWGFNRWGQAGNGNTDVTIYPIAVAAELRAVAISAGGSHSCALTAAFTIFCWGSNGFGQLGIPTNTLFSTTPALVRTAFLFESLDAGTTHTCAVARSGQPYCWGSNGYGEVGDAAPWRTDLPGPAEPTAVVLLPRVRAISAGANHTCAIDPAGLAWCWGRGEFGQLGGGDTRNHAVRQPVHLLPLHFHDGDKLVFTQVAAGGTTHVCGLADDSVFCWGTGPLGQLGSRESPFSTLPQRVDD
ncbi:MAG: RCC1 domain-containing protein [Longimicrobiales bacterium]